MLKRLIDLIDDSDTETIFKVLVQFVPKDKVLPDEIEAIERANKSIAQNGTISSNVFANKFICLTFIYISPFYIFA